MVRFKRCLTFFLVCYGCSVEENSLQPEAVLPEIIWVQAGLDSCRVYSVYFPSADIVFAGTNKGLYISSDTGASWIHINTDSMVAPVGLLSGHPEGSVLMFSAAKGILKSSDLGQSWHYMGLRNINVTSICSDPQGKIFAGTRGSGIYSSVFPYDEWFPNNPNPPSAFYSSLLINSAGTIFAGGSGVYRSDNNGKTWQLKNNGMGDWQVYSLIEGKNGEVFAGADVGGFFRSSDNGENWIRSNKGLLNTEILSLAINDAGHLFTGTLKEGVYISVDNGNEWTAADSGLTNRSVYSLAVSPGGFLYAGTFRGIFRSKSTNEHSP